MHTHREKAAKMQGRHKNDGSYLPPGRRQSLSMGGARRASASRSSDLTMHFSSVETACTQVRVPHAPRAQNAKTETCSRHATHQPVETTTRTSVPIFLTQWKSNVWRQSI